MEQKEQTTRVRIQLKDNSVAEFLIGKPPDEIRSEMITVHDSWYCGTDISGTEFMVRMKEVLVTEFFRMRT